ncbi:hypothetical protein QE152_g22863 [Popillia japonica]|uniref:SCAN domain-containing protein n=1 Tax=Popillia japonica TaxID=7064 RepID=A0AAW1KJ21_POPJA
MIKKNLCGLALAEFVSEDQFNETIKTFLNQRHDKEKPLWTRERIEEAITVIEQFKLAPVLKLKRTHKQYYYGKKYDIIEQDHEIILTPEDLPADSLENNNDASTSKDLPASELIDYNASTSNDLSVGNSTSTPVVLPASEGEAAANNNKACCVVCGMESTRAHSCDICKNPVHAICGNTVGEEGYGSKILCYLCQKEESIKDQRENAAKRIKDQRENAAKHLIRSAEKMKEVSLKKFKDVVLIFSLKQLRDLIKSRTFFREITRQSCYFNIFRELII